MTTTETRHQLATEYKNMYAVRAATNPAAFTLEFWQEHFATQTVCSVAGLRGNILDVGCGTGEIDIWLARAKRDVRITGIDVCREALDVAEKHRALEPVEIHQRLSFCESVIDRLPFADHSFDSCFVSHTMEHLRSHDALFRELYRVVKPEGTVVVIVPLGHFHDDPTHVWHFQPEQLQLHLSWFGENVKVWKSPDGQQLAASVTLPKRPRIIGMLRIKNEERWILSTLEKASSIVDGFVILDDGSTDKTPELCRSHPKVLRYEYQKEPVTDEARDKDTLLQWTLDVNPDWILALDGDELLEDVAPILLRRAMSSCPKNVSAFGLTFLYMWDTHSRHRVDDKYQNLKHLRLFRVADLGMGARDLKFKTSEHGSNLHCGSVPANLSGESIYLDVNVKHYGYFERAQRERKQAFYVQKDQVNAAKGYYTHLTDEAGMITLPWKERDITELASAEYCEKAHPPGAANTQN